MISPCTPYKDKTQQSCCISLHGSTFIFEINNLFYLLSILKEINYIIVDLDQLQTTLQQHVQ